MKILLKKLNFPTVCVLGICLYSQNSQGMLRVLSEDVATSCLKRVAGSVRFLSSQGRKDSHLREGYNPTGKFDHSHDKLAVSVDSRYDIAFLKKGFAKTPGNVVEIKETPHGIFGRVETVKKKS